MWYPISQEVRRPDVSSAHSIQQWSPFRRPNSGPDILRTRQTWSRRLRLVSGRKQVAPVRARTHLLKSTGGDEVTIHSYLPPSTKRPKHRGEAERNIGQRSSQAALRLKKILLRSQYGRE
jgi:hypothetical protein